MVFTRTWDAAYEAQPADTENISIGASRIRDLKTDVQERLVVDHAHAGNADDGKHKQISFLIPLGADPANIADHGFLYTKDVSAKAELFWEDEDGNVLQITKAGGLTAFPSGTKALFVQTAAPTGWTKDTDEDDKAIRIVSGTPGTGGATAFSSVFGSAKTAGSTTLTAAQSGLPVHSHGFDHGTGTLSNSTNFLSAQVSDFGTDGTIKSAGGAAAASSHNHTLSLDLQFMDVIKAAKD